MVKRIRNIEEMLSDRPTGEPTTFEGGPTGGKFLYLIAKIQADLPLSVLDRDIILETVRKQWLTTKEHAAFLRLAQLKHVETSEELAKSTKNLLTPSQRARWVRGVHGIRTKGAMKEFKARTRGRRKGHEQS